MNPLLQQLAGGAISTGLGMALGSWNDQRQLKQQGKLLEQQQQFNELASEAQARRQFEMWQKTGPMGMIKELRGAGLNPGLIYGMGGAGGQTPGAGQAATNANGAPIGGREIEAALGMSLPLALTKAQIENIKADTKQKEAATVKTTGVDTTKVQSEIDNLAQETDNKRLSWNLMNADLGLKALETKLKSETLETGIETAKTELNKLQEELTSSMVKANVDVKTQQAVIDEAFARAAKTWAETALAKSNITVNEEQKKLIMQQVDHLMHDTALGYGQNKIETLKAATELYKAEINAAKIPMESMEKILGSIIDMVILRKILTPKEQQLPPPNWKKGSAQK